MRTTVLAMACLAAMFSLLAAASAQTDRARPTGSAIGTPQGSMAAPPATPAKPGGPDRSVRAPGTLTAAPLTEAECKGLGGKLAVSSTCSTGRNCIRADQDGVLHQSCINTQ